MAETPVGIDTGRLGERDRNGRELRVRGCVCRQRLGHVVTVCGRRWPVRVFCVCLNGPAVLARCLEERPMMARRGICRVRAQAGSEGRWAGGALRRSSERAMGVGIGDCACVRLRVVASRGEDSGRLEALETNGHCDCEVKAGPASEPRLTVVMRLADAITHVLQHVAGEANLEREVKEQGRGCMVRVLVVFPA